MDARKTSTDPDKGPLENADFERIAQRAADIVVDQVALRIGQGVIKLVGYLFIAAVIAAVAYVKAREHL